MNVLVTGGNGFVGRHLVHRLLSAPGLAQPLTQLTVVDIDVTGLPDDERLHCIAGSIVDDEVLAAATATAPTLVFHLASLPGGAAEQNFPLGLAVNLTASVRLFEILRQQQNNARVVYTSTIAVYGSPMPARVDDQTLMHPKLSYGAHKYATEIVLDDYSRRGFLDGRTVRLPGIVARPNTTGLLSAFMSDVFWKLAAGEPFVCPVSEQAVAWWMSVPCCVDNLLHAAALETSVIAARRDYTLPVLRLTMAELIAGLAAKFGADRHALVNFQPDAKLEAGFGSYPPLDASAAEAIGFHHDGSVEQLIVNAMALGNSD